MPLIAQNDWQLLANMDTWCVNDAFIYWAFRQCVMCRVSSELNSFFYIIGDRIQAQSLPIHVARRSIHTARSMLSSAHRHDLIDCCVYAIHHENDTVEAARSHTRMKKSIVPIYVWFRLFVGFVDAVFVGAFHFASILNFSFDSQPSPHIEIDSKAQRASIESMKMRDRSFVSILNEFFFLSGPK